jgi:pyruvate kinase
LIQKSIANAKPIIIQSQVIEEMVTEESHVARQASNDISCATLEGADIFLLTHETSIGRDPAAATI